MEPVHPNCNRPKTCKYRKVEPHIREKWEVGCFKPTHWSIGHFAPKRTMWSAPPKLIATSENSSALIKRYGPRCGTFLWFRASWGCKDPKCPSLRYFWKKMCGPHQIHWNIIDLQGIMPVGPSVLVPGLAAEDSSERQVASADKWPRYFHTAQRP